LLGCLARFSSAYIALGEAAKYAVPGVPSWIAVELLTGFVQFTLARYAMNTHTGDTLYAESKVLSKRESKSLALGKRLQITRRSRRKRIRCRCRTRTWRRAAPPLRCGWDLPLARPGRLCGWRGKRLPPRSWPWRSWPALRRHTSTGKVSPLTAIGSPDLTVVAEAKPELIATQDKPAHRAMCWLMPRGGN
jgi:hypothetical protein